MKDIEQQAADDWSVANVMILSTPHLTDEYKPQMLTRARKLVDPGARMAALISLSFVLPEQEMNSACEDAFAIAEQIGNPWIRVRSMSEVYDVLPPTHKERFLEVALAGVAQITNEWHKRRAMGPLARYLTDEQAARALAIVRAFEDTQIRIEVLSRFARILSEDERVVAFNQVPTIFDEMARVSTMMAFLSHLPDEAKSQALLWVDDLKDASTRLQALTGLIAHFPDRKDEFLQQALTLLPCLGTELDRMYGLMGLIKYLPGTEKMEYLIQLRGMVNALDEPSFKAGPMISLARLAPEEEKQTAWQEALATARQIEGYRRAILLSVILGELPATARSDVLNEIMSEIQAD